MFALTHLPSPKLEAGERTHVAREPIDHARALAQHAAYRETLACCGVNVVALDVNAEFPDGTFLEDTAVVLDEVAVVGSLAAPSRRGETSRIARILAGYRDLTHVELPATLEGGDVLRIDRQLLVGQSSRTNAAGIEALATVARHLAYTTTSVPVHGCLHLKTACTALPDGRLLINPRWISLPAGLFETIAVSPDEPWAANTLPLTGQVLTSDAHPKTTALLEQGGYTVRTLDISEFAKAEGGVTCLSLILA